VEALECEIKYGEEMVVIKYNQNILERLCDPQAENHCEVHSYLPPLHFPTEIKHGNSGLILSKQLRKLLSIM
jgi:hypothetical protein